MTVRAIAMNTEDQAVNAALSSASERPAVLHWIARLAAIGVFAMLAYQVAQRQREIGIRQSLGANSRNIIRLVLWRGLVRSRGRSLD